MHSCVPLLNFVIKQSLTKLQQQQQQLPQEQQQTKLPLPQSHLVLNSFSTGPPQIFQLFRECNASHQLPQIVLFINDLSKDSTSANQTKSNIASERFMRQAISLK